MKLLIVALIRNEAADLSFLEVSLASEGKHTTWPTYNLANIQPSEHTTWPAYNLANIQSREHTTWRTYNLTNIQPDEHTTL